MLEEKSWDLTWEGKQTKIVQREITNREEHEALKQSMYWDETSKQQMIDYMKKNSLCVVASIKEAPFKKSYDAFMELPRKIGLKLREVFNELNDPDLGKLNVSEHKNNQGSSSVTKSTSTSGSSGS